jgi:lysophospholipase L1-like esterase
MIAHRMRVRWLLATLAVAALPPLPALAAQPDERPVRLVLVGDSTMAPNGGYGNALCARLPAVKCVNLARAGRSSSSFRAEGHWDEARKLLRDGQAYAKTYVMIQFGHNDQPGKPGRSTDLVTQFPANIERYAAETAEDGAIPVLVTPLARRGFKNGYLKDDLAPWAHATRRVAASRHLALLDLHAASSAAFTAAGQQRAATLGPPPKPNAKEPDFTHLGDAGAEMISAVVLKELTRLAPALAAGRP